MPKAIDQTDLLILAALRQNARISLAELGAEISLSGPATGERIRRLQDAGVIKGFTAEISPKALGFTLQAVVRIRPRPGFLHTVEQMIHDEPRFTDCDKVTGEDCFVVRLLLREIEELDPILEPFHERANTNTSMIKSAPFRDRLPILEPPDLRA